MSEIAGFAGNHFAHYRIIASGDTPDNNTYDMDDEGDRNTLQSGYLTFTTAPPDAPTNLTTTSTTGGVSLSWTAPASSGTSNLETYGIWRATASFSAITSATLLTSFATSTGTSYSDTSAVHGTTYYYRVTATNATATSSLSNERSSGSNTGRVIRLKGVRLR